MKLPGSLTTRTAFSLIETLIALMVIAVGLTALLQAFPQGLATGRHATARTQATLLGRGQMEQLRLRGFTALAEMGSADTPGHFLNSKQEVVAAAFRWQAEITRRAEDLLEVHLQVVWPWPVPAHQVQLATYVSQH